MNLSPRHHSTLGDLLRLLAVWIAVVVLVQGFAAAWARTEGPLHRHRAEGTASLLAHRQHHSEAQRHYHAGADASVLSAAADAALQEGLDAAASALAAAFALLATALALRPAGSPGRVWHAALAWANQGTTVEPLLKPPRRA
jgi:hypothetical protein